MLNSNILIDSTGLPNDISFDLTKLNNHNGQKSNEIRLIMVMEETTGYPLYFKYIPGNIVDVSTLGTVVEELIAYNIPLDNAILDAGYYSEKNIKLLYDLNIGFMTRSIPNRLIHKEMINTHGQSLEDPKYLVDYQDRRLFIKKVPYTLSGMNLFAFICLDINEYHSQRRDLWNKCDLKSQNDDIKSKLDNCGKFILVSSRDYEISSVLSVYYGRQSVEQLFDYSKNDLDLLPLRTHNEDTFRGHLLICFMATIAHTYLTQLLLKSKKSLKSILIDLNRYNCQVFDDRIIPNIANKDVNEAFKALKIDIPAKIML
jgi:transposase